MKRSLHAFAAVLLLALPSTLSAGPAEKGRADQDISFESLLGKLQTEYSKGRYSPLPSSAVKVLDDRYWVTVSASGSKERTALLEAGLDIIIIQDDKVDGIITGENLALLEKGRGASRILRKIPLSEYLPRFKDFPSADSAYHNYQETKALLSGLASKHSDIASLFSLGKSFENMEIWCLRLNSSAKDQAASTKPGAVFIGNHHAREHLSNEVPLLFAAWLLDNRAAPEVRKYLDSLDIYIIPMANPDGVEYDIKPGSYQYYRKNRRVNSDKSVGVDLNRNYDSWFGGAGSSHSPGSETYCGPSAFSEPESQAVKRFVEARKNLKTMATYHSFGGTVLYPYGGSDDEVPDPADRQALLKIAGKMAALSGYTAKKSSDLYLATGDAADWAYDAAKVLAFTVELEGNSFYPGSPAIEKAVRNNVKSAAYLLSVTANPQAAE